MTSVERLLRAEKELSRRYAQIQRNDATLRAIADLPADESSQVLGALVQIVETRGRVSNYALLTHRTLNTLSELTGMTRRAVVELFLSAQPPSTYWYAWAVGPAVDDIAQWQSTPPDVHSLKTLAALRGWDPAEVDELPERHATTHSSD